MESPTNRTESRSPETVAAVSALMVVIILSATLGNGLVLGALFRFPALRTRTSVLMANLAVADLLIGLIGQPVMLWSYLGDRWPAGPVLCSVSGASIVVLCLASMTTLAGIAVDRYVAIVHPFRYRELMSPRRLGLMVAWTWLQPAVLAALPVLAPWSSYTYHAYICSVDWAASPGFSWAVLSLAFLAPLGVMIRCYAGILTVAHGQSRKIADAESLGAGEAAAKARRARQLRRDAKAALMLLVLIGNFLACWSPYTAGIICLTLTGGHCPFPDAAFVAATFLGLANAGMDPLIYGLMDRKMRRAVWQIVICKLHPRPTDPETSNYPAETHR